MKVSELIKSQLANCHAIKTYTIYEKIGFILLILIQNSTKEQNHCFALAKNKTHLLNCNTRKATSFP